jgi:mono/diheme cytochrome c family protein
MLTVFCRCYKTDARMATTPAGCVDCSLAPSGKYAHLALADRDLLEVATRVRARKNMEIGGMSGAKLFFGVIGSSLLAFGAAAAEPDLPPGPNRELVTQTCGACHDLDGLVAAAGASREDWDGAIDEMIGNGMHVTPEDRAKILDYLATALGPSARKQAGP